MKKYILCEKNYKKFNTREERGLQRCCSIGDTVAITSQQTTVLQHRGHGRDNIATNETKKREDCNGLQHRGHGRDNIATNETKKSTGKTDAYREGYRGCQKKSGQGESGKAMTFSQHLRGRCGGGHSLTC